MSDNATIARITTMVAPLVADLKLDLYDIEFRGGTLRITVDTPVGSDGGVDLDTIALVTRMVSRDLDHEDPIPGRYTLEVTSPGLERTLRVPAHFEREIGKTVAIRLRDTAGGDRRVQGVLVAADEQAATIRLDNSAASDAESTEKIVPYHQIDRAKTVFVWGPAPKPGKAPSAKKSPAANTGPARKAAATKAPAPATPSPSVDEPTTTAATQEAS